MPTPDGKSGTRKTWRRIGSSVSACGPAARTLGSRWFFILTATGVSVGTHAPISSRAIPHQPIEHLGDLPGEREPAVRARRGWVSIRAPEVAGRPAPPWRVGVRLPPRTLTEHGRIKQAPGGRV